jgi:hypothetical protein
LSSFVLPAYRHWKRNLAGFIFIISPLHEQKPVRIKPTFLFPPNSINNHHYKSFMPVPYLCINFYLMLNTIESAIEDIKRGKLVIVVDDEDRENEGDFIAAARNVTPEVINFMSKEGRGLICAPMSEDRADELQLELMVSKNTAVHETPFTVSVDLIGHGCTTGISAHDRAKTVQALIDPATKPEDLGTPGAYLSFTC